MTFLANLNKHNSLVSTINSILSKHGINESITLSDITITEKTVSDLVKSESKLSNSIVNFLWPSISKASVYHYTSRDSAESILNSGTFRLTNIEKRYNEGEIVSFCQSHKLNGYLEKEDNGKPKYRNLIMPNTFYASFTDTNISQNDEEYFWSTFASCDGVRLKFDIQATNPDFRKVRYEESAGEPLEIIQELTETIRNTYGLEFILKGISRLCSFYLSGADYGMEKEYRLLYRTWEGQDPQPKGTGPYSYIEIPLNKMTECGHHLSISEVQANTEIKMPSRYVFSKRGGNI
ncbi:hypothetical protein [Serratia liquefaciens]|uniref:hypothetical protein n=1 Tax=Serratia liquefaciens TaxID=614 RepID=UPI00301C2AF8